MYCYAALSFIAGEINSHVLKFLLKLFTFFRMLNNNIKVSDSVFLSGKCHRPKHNTFFSLSGVSQDFTGQI